MLDAHREIIILSVRYGYFVRACHVKLECAPVSCKIKFLIALALMVMLIWNTSEQKFRIEPHFKSKSCKKEYLLYVGVRATLGPLHGRNGNKGIICVSL